MMIVDYLVSSSDSETLDEKNIFMLIMLLKKNFNQHNLLLTSSFIAKSEHFPDILNIASISEYLDYVHLIPKYDYIETWPGNNRVENILKERSISTMEYSINRLINSGVSSAKIILGLEFIGLYFNSILDLSVKHATFRKTIGYNEVCNLLSNDPETKWDKFFDDTTNINIAKHESKSWHGIIRRIKVLVFENSRSIANKVKIIVRHHLGGVMAFPIGMDDHDGNCGIDDDTFNDFTSFGSFDSRNTQNTTEPLLKTINYVLHVAPFEENVQARQPNSDDLTYNDVDRLWDTETKNDIISRMPENYKPLAPIIQSANDALIVAYDKLREKADLYKKDRTILSMVYSLLFQVPKIFIGVLDRFILT